MTVRFWTRSLVALIGACALSGVSLAQSGPPSDPYHSNNPYAAPSQGPFATPPSSTPVGGRTVQNSALNAGEQAADQQLRSLLPALGEDSPDWAKRIEIEGGLFQRGKPGQSILTVQPLFQSDGKIDTVFTQASLYHYAMFGEYRWTGNLGLGYRRLLADKTVLLGLNGFYDDEFSNGHQRTSVGGEAKWGPLDFGANRYFAVSDTKNVNGDTEKALGGWDSELGTQVPFVPWMSVYARYYRWYSDKAVSDTQGKVFSTILALHPNVSLELGRADDDFSNYAARSQNYILMRFKLASLGGSTLTTGPVVTSTAFVTRDLTDHTLDKVRRENRIIVERRIAGGVIIKRGT